MVPLVAVLTGFAVVLVNAQLDTIYMDGPAFCGKTIVVAEQVSRLVEPRGSAGLANPLTTCAIHFESQHQESSYIFEISVEAATFRDCGLDLRVFDGPQVGGNYIRQMGCGSNTLSKFYSKDRSITVYLTRTRNVYQFGNHFRLRVRTFKSPDAADEYLGTASFSAGAIIGIVLGVAVLIALAILLGWCYKTGRLPGYSGTEYPSNYKNQNLDTTSISKSEGGITNTPGFVSWNNMRDADKTSTTSVSRSNFDLDNPDMWASLTGPSLTKKNTNRERTRNLGSEPNISRGYNNNDTYYNVDVKGGKYGKTSSSADNLYENFNRNDANQLSHSPGSRIRRDNVTANNARKETTFDGGELGLRGKSRGRRENESSANQKSSDGKTMKKRTGSGLFENPDSEGYLYDYEQVQALSDENPQKGKKKTQDFGTELKDAIRRNSMKRQQSASSSDAPGLPGSSEAELSKINFSDDNVSVPKYEGDSELSTSNPALGKGEDTGPDAQSSPKSKKKKRKTKRKGGQEEEDAENKSPKSKRKAEENEPPEVYAPIFKEDEATDPASVPNMYQPGYQGNYPPAPFYGPQYPGAPYPQGGYPQAGYPGYPPGIPGMPPTGPYQTAGQAAWYVQGTPDGRQKMAFAMHTHSQGSHDDALGHPGMPNSQSTPYQYQYGAPGGPGNALVPAGTVLDDPQVPPPGTSLVRYDDDPTSGIKTSQVIWTDSKPDPTDPPPDSNPQITRKTITRVTTKATTDELPDAPNPSLHDMSYRTAQQIQASGGADPAFMSPSRGAPALQYGPANSIQYAIETPERTNASFYSGPHGPTHIPGAPGPVIHEAPERSEAFRDKIKVSTIED